MAPYGNYSNPETARRTFERDKKTLRQVGFDIQTSPPEDGPATYVLARPRDALGRMQLDHSERIALAVAVAMVDLGGALPTDRTLIKLGAGTSAGMRSTTLTWATWRPRKSMTCSGPSKPARRSSSTTRTAVADRWSRFGSSTTGAAGICRP